MELGYFVDYGLEIQIYDFKFILFLESIFLFDWGWSFWWERTALKYAETVWRTIWCWEIIKYGRAEIWQTTFFNSKSNWNAQS